MSTDPLAEYQNLRKSLETLRREFEARSVKFAQDLPCWLFHLAVGETAEPILGYRGLADRLVWRNRCEYGPPDSNGRPVFRRELWYGTDLDAVDAFEKLAQLAVGYLPKLPPAITGRLSPNTLCRRDRAAWLFTMFELAWSEPSNSPLHVERQAWGGPVDLTLRPFRQHTFSAFPEGWQKTFGRFQNQETESYCSTFSSVYLAAVFTIDVILGALGKESGPLTETLSKKEIGELFVVHRNHVEEKILKAYYHEPVGSRFRMRVADMPPAYFKERGLASR